MCVAGLNVSTQPCAHRWYHLVRPCHPANNLANCPERLRLEGWETRTDDCPFCDVAGSAQMVHESTHRLFGSTSSASSVASSSASSSSDHPAMTRYRRSGSSGTVHTLSRQSSSSSSGIASSPLETVLDRGQMQREMNDRLLHYLTTDPHQVLPSARKNYPTYPATSSFSSSVSAVTSPRDDSSASGSPSDAASIASANGMLSRGWSKAKGVRFSRNIFKT